MHKESKIYVKQRYLRHYAGALLM